ncbi:hypothetical protein [Spirillospora sp. NPDC047279]|uniref:ABC transporter substrate-binding protein n=1 Tax=Spirillospora sp. NPDC047279 TaxID=3155478 RepID=UPI0033F2EF1A
MHNHPTPDPTLTRRSALRLFGVGALGIAGASALAGCAPSGGGSAGGDKNADHFTFTGWAMNEASTKDAVGAIVSAHAAASKVKIDTASYPYNDFLNQLILKLRGGEVTGAIQLDVAWLGAIASMGKLMDLSTQAAAGGYTDVALSGGKYEGKQYGLPWATGSIGLIANTELLEKAGVDEMPTTIEEFEAALRAVKKLGNGVVPYAGSTKPAQLKDIIPWIQTFGGKLLDGGQVTIGDDASVAAVDWYKKLYDEKLIAPDVDRFDARALFSQGKAAFYDDAPLGKGVVAKQAADKSLGTKIEPLARPVLKKGDSPRAMLWGGLIAVVDGEGATKAAEFAARTTSDTATTVGYFTKTAYPPSTTQALADKAVTGDQWNVRFGERVTKTATPNPFWQYAAAPQMDTALAQQVQAALVGQAKTKDALGKAAETIKPLVK